MKNLNELIKDSIMAMAPAVCRWIRTPTLFDALSSKISLLYSATIILLSILFGLALGFLITLI